MLLVLLTLTWGINWPVMKIGVTEYPPLAFRALSIWLGLPFVYLGYWVENSRKMAYKSGFRPLEGYGPDGWVRLRSDEPG